MLRPLKRVTKCLMPGLHPLPFLQKPRSVAAGLRESQAPQWHRYREPKPCKVINRK